MQARINYMSVANGAFKAMMGMETYLNGCGLDKKLMDLVKLRVSQVNGCAYCIDMHWKDLRALGETEQRLYGLDAWAESPYYTDRERAALQWAEAITHVGQTHAPDSSYGVVKAQFTEKEIADLTFAVATINSWNRLAIAFRSPAGSYQPPRHG